MDLVEDDVYRGIVFDDVTQITEHIGVTKINDNLFLGICGEEARMKFTDNIPNGMFDTVACLSVLDGDLTYCYDGLECRLIGDVPVPDDRIKKTDILIRYNDKILGDGEDSSDDFKKQLPKLLDILDQYKKLSESGRVLILINCYAGIRRASAVAMAFLMKTMNISTDESLKRIRTVRPIACPPESFIDVLNTN